MRTSAKPTIAGRIVSCTRPARCSSKPERPATAPTMEPTLAPLQSVSAPHITEVVMAEVARRIDRPEPPESVPFFRNDDEASLFLRLRGMPMPEHD